MPLLVQLKDGVSRLIQSFQTKKASSSFLVHESPAQWLIDNLETIGAKDGPLGRKLAEYCSAVHIWSGGHARR